MDKKNKALKYSVGDKVKIKQLEIWDNVVGIPDPIIIKTIGGEVTITKIEGDFYYVSDGRMLLECMIERKIEC